MENDETVPPQTPQQVTRPQNRFALILTVVLLAVIIGGGIVLRKRSTQGASGMAMQTGKGAESSGSVVKKVNDLTVTFQMPSGLRLAQNDFLIEFRKGDSLVDVGNVKFSLDMNMPGMTMHDGATVTPTGKPGQYRAAIKPEMAGDWVAMLEYSGPQGQSRTSFQVSVKQ